MVQKQTEILRDGSSNYQLRPQLDRRLDNHIASQADVVKIVVEKLALPAVLGVAACANTRFTPRPDAQASNVAVVRIGQKYITAAIDRLQPPARSARKSSQL